MPALRCLPVLGLALAITASAQHGNFTVSNPHTDDESRAAGERSYVARCASCHGLKGVGSSAGPDLTTGSFRRANSDEALFNVITKGIPGTAMPAFGINPREVWQLITYLRSLSVGRGAEKAKGDPERGAKVFEKSGCSGCHIIDGAGGVLGPDLTTVGARRSLGELHRSLTDPDETVANDYWSVRIKRAGAPDITGIRLNEDTYSLQIRDDSGRLRSVPKSGGQTAELIRTSPMPSFKDKLSAADLDDLIAWLASLKTPGGQR